MRISDWSSDVCSSDLDRQLRTRLCERRFVRRRVDLEQLVAGFHTVAFREEDLRERAGHLCAHVHGVRADDIADRRQLYRCGTTADGGEFDGRRAMTMLGRCAVTFPAPRHQRDHDDENGDQRQLTRTQGTTPSAWAGRPPASWARVASARYQSRYDCTLATRACATDRNSDVEGKK